MFHDLYRKYFNRKLPSALLAYLYIGVMMIPNLVLAMTEPYSIWSHAVSVVLPLGFYMVWSVLLRRSGITIWLSFPFIFFGAFQIVLLYLFGNSIIATDMFTNLLTTNPDEAGELLGNIWPAVVLVCVLYLPMLWMASVEIRQRRSIPRLARRWIGIPGAVILALGLAMIYPARQLSGNESILKNDVFPINVFYNLKLSISEHYRMLRYEQSSEGFSYEAVRREPSKEREIYLFVIGEASRAANWQLYGYERETTPRLCEMEDLVVFRNMLTQSNTTHKSVPLILSSIDTDEHDELFRRKGLPALFSEAGFETWFISNQAPQNAMVDKLAADAEHRYYEQQERMDMRLLERVKMAVEQSTAPRMMIILHTYGSHFSYYQRYTREFARFAPEADVAIAPKHSEIIRNTYDNSLLYTDHFLAETIAYLRSLEDCCTAMLYCADHGEDLFDDRRERFLHASPTITYWQLHVASLAWFSPRYEERFPLKAEAARGNVMAPATTHSLFHTMADMASIESPYLDAGVSLVCPAFDFERPRYYLNDHNQAESFRKMGLTQNDLKQFAERAIELN